MDDEVILFETGMNGKGSVSTSCTTSAAGKCLDKRVDASAISILLYEPVLPTPSECASGKNFLRATTG